MLLSIARFRFTWFNKCKRFAGLNFKCKLEAGFLSKNCQLFSGRGIFVLDTLAKTFTWGYTDIPNEIVDGIYHNRYEATYGTGEMHKYSSGDIYVKQDTIVMGYFYKEWPRKKGEF
ncbi:MAG: hypothetical protein KF845_06900 [Cyclobacteriaceae bacterium]|nr:hypothetical protein [Cyclobacteriaceae bacterium]